MWQLVTSLDAWAALVSLAALEIVLGIDNVIFLSILVSRLDARRGETARRIGLALALVFRVALLFRSPRCSGFPPRPLCFGEIEFPGATSFSSSAVCS
jgi:Integral membrane protein TerC family